MADNEVDVPQEGMQIGDDLYVRIVAIAALREQDVNAQQMKPRHFDRLTENVRTRGALESLPYCSRPGDEGPTYIVSGHHRARAARAAGLKRIPVIVDTRVMTRSEVVAKQIAHNELHGEPDEEILARLIKEIESVDDLLTTGLDEDMLPTLREAEDTSLNLPRVEFDWRMLTLMFLPEQLEDVKEALSLIEKGTDTVGIAPVALFEPFSKALLEFGRAKNIRSLSASILVLTEIARREVEAARRAEAAAPRDTTPAPEE